MIKTRETEKARLRALREAVRAGVEDIEAGRFHTFESEAALRRYIGGIAENALAGRSRRKRTRKS